MNQKIIESSDLEGSHLDHLLLFHQPRFVLRDQSIETKCFQLRLNKQLVAFIPFQIIDHKAVSLVNSPFGGMVVVSETTLSELKDFLIQVKSLLLEKGINKIEIKCPPKSYSLPFNINADEIYLSCGFKVLHTEINQYIAPSKVTHFKKVVASNRRSHINHSIKSNYVFRILSDEYLKAAYELIQQTHKVKGYAVTMTFKDLKRMFDNFSDKYLLFGLFHGSELIACSVSIIVSPEILYNFYHGNALEYKKFSPLTSLIQGVYEYCVKANISILDLGISSENGILNQGLFQFKRSLGAQMESKKMYQLEL